MSKNDSLRNCLAGICWLVGLVTYIIIILIANKGDSWFPLKTTIVFSLIAGIPQGIGFALSIGHGYVGGGIAAFFWATTMAASAYLALNYGIKVALVGAIIGGIVTIMSQLLANNKKNA